MPLPTIILNPPQLLVTLSNSPRGYVPYGNTTFTVGFVQMVYDGSLDTIVGDYVYFYSDKVPAFVYGSTVYYVVPENQRVFKEPIVP